MAVTLKVHDIKGKEVGVFSYTPFKEELSGAMLAQVLRVYVTNQHQGTRKAKTRGELKRPDTKPWKQKGTGRARHGSKNSPIWVGGGVTFAPRPHQRRLSLPVSLKRKAMRYFLDTEIAEGGVVLFDVPTKVVKTKDAVSFIDAVNSFKLPVVLVLQEKDDRTANAFRNIEKVTIRRANLISPHDMSKKALYVFDKNALATLVQRVTKNAS